MRLVYVQTAGCIAFFVAIKSGERHFATRNHIIETVCPHKSHNISRDARGVHDRHIIHVVYVPIRPPLSPRTDLLRNLSPM